MELLRELYTTCAPTMDDYTEFLKDRGMWREPRHKGKNGFLVIKYHPEDEEKAYTSLEDAKNACPRGRGNHWQVIDLRDGNVAAMPDWVTADAYLNWHHNAAGY